MFFLYDISIYLFIFGMKFFSLFNEKARKGIIGRKESINIIQGKFSKQDEIIWMHAASLGEFHQGFPILEGLKEKYPKCKLLVTFFSPSGYENIVNKENKMDITFCYLPFDEKKNINEFINNINIVLFFTVKYDFWFRLLKELKAKNIPIYVVSALFYKEQTFFKPWGKFFVSQLRKNVNIFFHQTQNSLELAKSIGLNNSIYSGDTRFDNVKQNVKNFKPIKFIDEFCKNNRVLVVGSSWKEEEDLVREFAEKNTNIKVILAPHNIYRSNDIIKKIGKKAILYSNLSENLLINDNFQILIIDNIGLLSKLYYYADIAVVGGGFHGKGLHNILEAAIYHKPVIFGNKYNKNPEADLLIKEGGAKSFPNYKHASDFIEKLFSNKKLIIEMSENTKRFFEKQPNSKKIVLDEICSKIKSPHKA